MCKLLDATVAFALLAVCTSASLAQDHPRDSEISQALSAAPPSIASGAAVAVMDGKGNTTQLRPGSNGWTCLAPQAGQAQHDTIEHHPSCFDKYGLEWIEAYIAHRKPDAEHVGYSYMLQGGSAWSNTDPTAKELAPGEKEYIHMPPHIMILNARVAESSGFPSGQASPDTYKPFVMFGGTAYALVIIPLS
jgi:hypothetical protein